MTFVVKVKGGILSNNCKKNILIWDPDFLPTTAPSGLGQTESNKAKSYLLICESNGNILCV